MKSSFKEFIKESPLNDYETIGDWSKGSSFRDKRDRMLLTHPRAIERVRKKFGNTSFDFDFYFVNSSKANKHTEVGLVHPDWVEANLGEEVYKAIEKNLNQDHIQVIFTNNKGAERMPLTAHMMAHRLGHALARDHGQRKEHSQYNQAEKQLIDQFSSIMEYYGLENMQDIRKYGYNIDSRHKRQKQLTMMYFFYEVATFKSARDRNLRDWFEVLNELIAQYLTTGKIKFNKAPRCFGGGSFGKKQNYCCKEEDLEDIIEYLNMLARDMEFMIDDILSSVVNSVLVM